MLPSTTARVPLNTPDQYNKAIRRQMVENVSRFANAGPAEIDGNCAPVRTTGSTERSGTAIAGPAGPGSIADADLRPTAALRWRC